MTDTTREAVERLAKYAAAATPDAGHTAATLRTLAAENDTLRAEVAALRQAVEQARQWDEYHPAFLDGARAGAWRARRDALEEAAVFCETYDEAFTSRRAGTIHHVTPKMERVSGENGKAYAAAIRARAGGAGDE